LISVRGREGIFLLCHCEQTRFRAHPASYPMHNRVSFSRCKNVWGCTSTTQCIFIVWFLAEHRYNFLLYYFQKDDFLALMNIHAITLLRGGGGNKQNKLKANTILCSAFHGTEGLPE